MQDPMTPRPNDPDKGMNRDVNDPTERPYYAAEVRDVRTVGFGDLVRWGPILAGFASTFGILLLLGALGLAVGLTTVTSANGAAANAATSTTAGAVWGAIIVIVSFFVGGWIAVRALPMSSTLTAVINSTVVWAFSMLFLLLVAALGLAGLSGVASLFGSLASPANSLSPSTAANAGVGTAWGTFIGLALAWIAALVGGLVGMVREPNANNR
ncbi:MAG: hypothetical protein M1401_02940 [Chloroflexi bacterium]|nr:hypothetical protein [Chloroflexota bacterium]MCL5107831.1 hypothetical protein [Chloroflexota bacterium]